MPRKLSERGQCYSPVGCTGRRVETAILFRVLAYFQFLLLGGLAYLLLRGFSPRLAKAVLLLAVGVQVIAIVRDLLT